MHYKLGWTMPLAHGQTQNVHERNRRQLRVGLLLAVVLFPFRVLHAYPVAGALPLEKLVTEADVIVKAEVVGSKPLNDEPWFEKFPGFGGFATELKVISWIKGPVHEGKVIFQHYAHAVDDTRGYMFMPQCYELQPSKTYLIFAKSTDKPGVLRQLWKNHRTKEDQGILRTADSHPVESFAQRTCSKMEHYGATNAQSASS